MMIFTTWTMNFKMCPNFLKWQTQRNHHFTECYFDLWAHKMLIRGPENFQENQIISFVMQSLLFFQLSSLIFILKQSYSLWWNKLLIRQFVTQNMPISTFEKSLKIYLGLGIIFLIKICSFSGLTNEFLFLYVHVVRLV